MSPAMDPAEITQQQINAIVDAVVSSFLVRNPDLADAIHRDTVLYGAMSAETLHRVNARMDEEDKALK